MQADVFHRGRPFGGLAFLYKKALVVHITHIGSDYKNLDVICLKFGDRKVFVVNVYVPCCNNDNEDEINELVANIFCNGNSVNVMILLSAVISICMLQVKSSKSYFHFVMMLI